ncbi:MAG: DUF2961 domain-containing protein, partial [Verrucomicrobia bacterium]|nr:DUF2961 domain-containing protein [Verrucomicrobiota bacterium]
MNSFSGLGMHLGNLSRLSHAKTRSISAENFTGAKAQGGMAVEGTGAIHARGLGIDASGRGWKVSPSIEIVPGENRLLCDIEGQGAIQQIWCVVSNVRWRNLILRVFWDDQEHPSVESPLGDFFACGWNRFAQVSSLSVCVNPGRAFNCYWEMPFRRRARIMLENRDPDEPVILYYQINYTLTDVPEDAAYFHAQFHRTNPLPFGEDYVILDGVRGQGHYVGTYLAWGVNNAGWWGEGEIKFFMDGDTEFPTICGTGTEDYFCGAYNFDGGVIDPNMTSAYREFTTPYSGLPQVLRPDGTYESQTRFGMYRWHIMDPIRFETDLKV